MQAQLRVPKQILSMSACFSVSLLTGFSGGMKTQRIQLQEVLLSQRVQ